MDEKSIYKISKEIPLIQAPESLDNTIIKEHFPVFDILLEEPIYIKYDDAGINHELSLSIDNDLNDIVAGEITIDADLFNKVSVILDQELDGLKVGCFSRYSMRMRIFIM
jgi:hypothetical protein